MAGLTINQNIRGIPRLPELINDQIVAYGAPWLTDSKPQVFPGTLFAIFLGRDRFVPVPGFGRAHCLGGQVKGKYFGQKSLFLPPSLSAHPYFFPENKEMARSTENFAILTLGKAKNGFKSNKINENINKLRNMHGHFVNQKAYCFPVFFHGAYPPSSPGENIYGW